MDKETPQDDSEDPVVRMAYANKLSELIFTCLDSPSTSHGLLIVSNSNTDMLSLFSINAAEDDVSTLLHAAYAVVMAQPDVSKTRTLN